MQRLSLTRTGAVRAPHRAATRGMPAVQANTLWSLKSKKEAGPKAHTIDISEAIGRHKLCSVGAKDYSTKSEESIDYTVVEHGGVHLLFEAEGTSNPLDSPSMLFVTDVDSACEVLVEGKPIPKGTRTRVRPGATIRMGGDAEYEVLRNVFAHA